MRDTAMGKWVRCCSPGGRARWLARGLVHGAATGLVLAAASLPAYAADAEPQSSPCAGIRIDAERLACYDQAEARRMAGPEAPPAKVSPEALFGAGTVAAASPKATKPAEVERKDVQSISATIRALRATPDRKHIIELDNDQVWLQVDTESMRLKVGAAITISRGLLGAFYLKADTKQLLRVKRME